MSQFIYNNRICKTVPTFREHPVVLNNPSNFYEDCITNRGSTCLKNFPVNSEYGYKQYTRHIYCLIVLIQGEE